MSAKKIEHLSYDWSYNADIFTDERGTLRRYICKEKTRNNLCLVELMNSKISVFIGGYWSEKSALFAREIGCVKQHETDEREE